LLEKNASQPPSFSVHLHPEHWTLNNVSKFLYNTQISGLLDDIRAHRIPVDFLELFDAAKIPFYDGCMIVELLDYRPQQRNKEAAPDKPERTRVVLHPNGETLFADICSLNRKNGNKWSDRDALEIEARLLLATSPPLCLAPDPHLTRVANHVLRVSTPTVPISLKRKAAAMDPEEDEVEKARRTKIMQFMTPRPGRTHNQKYTSVSPFLSLN
ncbi:Spt20 family-domain-containing protein, partial [Mycena alexandri]